MTEIELTRAEGTLVRVLLMATVSRAGTLTTEQGYGPATPEQQAEILEFVEHSLVEVVLGLREPGEFPKPEEIAASTEIIARGTVAKIFGMTPRDGEISH